MTLNGFLREVGAAQRRAARNEERRHRLHARALKLEAKIDELERAAAEVEAFVERMDQLTTIHHTVDEPMDWADIGARPPPVEPQKTQRWEEAAMRARDEFRPTFWQRLFGKEEKIRARLDLDIVAARQREEVSYQGALKLFHQQLGLWKDLNRLAAAILHGDTVAYREALDELEPLSEMQEMGCEFEVGFPDAGTAEIVLMVESEKVIPRETKSLTKSGKLSVKSLAQGKFFELYQDYVCGCALRTARELLSFLPLHRVIVHVRTPMLDSATGHLRAQTILSVGIPRATVEGLNFVAIDPSDSMKLFPHRMGFKRSQGFFAVQPLETTEYPNP